MMMRLGNSALKNARIEPLRYGPHFVTLTDGLQPKSLAIPRKLHIIKTIQCGRWFGFAGRGGPLSRFAEIRSL